MDDSMTYGEIRKRVEVKMNRQIGVDASQAQIEKIRELAPLVAEGKMKYEDAYQEVLDTEEDE